jgi:predicted ATPase
VVFVTGEAGIGKTALVEAVVHPLRGDPGLGLGHGQCIEQYGAGEAYLPLLEALGQLGRALGGEHLVAILAQVAPSWAVQLPALLSAPVLADLHRTLAGATRTRMLRELAEGLEALSAARPLVLVLEDLHWSDTSTVEALALLARRREPARLLVLGTYRPVDLIVHAHPLKRVQQELAAHGQCVDLPLSALSEAAVAAYVAQRGVTPEAHAGVTAAVYRRTEGHPLFMVQMVDYLAQHDVLRATIQAATSEGAARALDTVVPPRLRQLLDAQFERLTAAEQQGLEVGSVAGVEFVVASVAAGGPTPPEAVEAVCEGLARRGQFLEDRGLVEWPDGTVSGCYGFRHALYQEVVYQQMSAGRRVRCHQAIGARLEQAYGTRTHEVAAELAMHFERGRDSRRAVQYLQQAAENAAQRHASHEVIALLTKGLELLAPLPETPARAQQELALQIALGPALIATKGTAAPAVEQAYARARVLCAQVEETSQLVPALRGLCWFYTTRGALVAARELGEQLDRLAQHEAAPTSRLEAHDAFGVTLFYLGDYAMARAHLEQGIALIDPATQRALALRHGVAPGVRCLATAANALWCLGYPAQAIQRGQEALALAQTLPHPHSLAYAQQAVLFLYHHCRDVAAMQAQAAALLTLATAQEFPLYVGWGTWWQGWVRTVQGQEAAGLAQMQRGMAAILATRQTLSRPLCLLLLSEVARYTGQVAEGRGWLAEAQAACEASARGDLLAEVYRLQGELLLRHVVPEAAQAEAFFQQALTIARRQHAKSWELRAAMSLSRLWQQQGQRAEARALLAPIYDWFTEGFDTADLQEAQALLETVA